MDNKIFFKRFYVLIFLITFMIGRSYAESENRLTLHDAIQKALQQSPHLQAFNSLISAAAGEKSQAGSLPNPELGIEFENVGGTGLYHAFNSAEVNYGVSQLIELGEKISARVNIASHNLEIARLEYQGAALDLIQEVTVAYAQTCAAQKNVQLTQEQKKLADDILKSVTDRVNAAANPMIQKIRAQVEVAAMAITLDKSIRDFASAQKILGALLGEDPALFRMDIEDFFNISKPEPGNFENRLKNNPKFLIWGKIQDRSIARLHFEKAALIPDPRITIGNRTFYSTGNRAFFVGFSLPIPIFNANAGNIEKAQFEAAGAEQDVRQSLLMLKAKWVRSIKALDDAYVQATMLKNEILPAARHAFLLANEGFELGRFSYLDVLDAQRSFFSFQQQYIEALKDYHIAKSTFERLTAEPLPKLSEKGAAHVQ